MTARICMEGFWSAWTTDELFHQSKKKMYSNGNKNSIFDIVAIYIIIIIYTKLLKLKLDYK